MIGRAALYGLGAGGEAGVARAINIFRGELDTTMILAGLDDTEKIDHRTIASGAGRVPAAQLIRRAGVFSPMCRRCGVFRRNNGGTRCK